MKQREKYENALLTIRFIGDDIDIQGVSIYDFASSLLSIQRIINKAHLSMEGRLKKGAYPEKAMREKISLSIGERRRSSDAFALIPLLTDPVTQQYLKKVADYVVSGLVGYWVGDVMNRLRNDDEEDKQQFIGSIHADVVNIVNRIDAAGGVERIEIGAPNQRQPMLIEFDAAKKQYVNDLSNEFYLGRSQVIVGNVYRLYPNSLIVTIRRAGGRKVNVYLNQENFDKIRYDQGDDLQVRFRGRPRYKFGIESLTVTDFEADSVEIEDEI
ncbi:hypothetical protein JQS35_16315 [Alcaligenes faecalis subsp. faecalis]|uniref:hypothetical protein n=1 Tax=Alcaligenes faecalis TaxID=511 RepID=UPI001F1B5902|nr:hypothetical protein [Alcaligenes faecalis]MBW4790166.1 hypothetical protein [Alcaligenes faecalis subsp. faecalis]